MDLVQFGFTPTETRVYLALLPISPATGYAVAQSAHLARANTYDALEGLAARGAVTRLPGRPVRFSALDPEALVLRLRREFTSGLDSLATALSRIQRAEPGPAPPAVESISDAALFVERVAACALDARSELLAVIGPWAAAAFAALEDAHTRVSTRVLSLGTPAPPGAAVREVAEREIETYWGGLPVALVADRRSAVCGVVLHDGRASGIATEHPGLIPFLRHLLRRELASAPMPRVS